MKQARFVVTNSLVACKFALILACLCGCTFLPASASTDSIARERMRALVSSIATHAYALNSNALIVPQNGEELLTRGGEPSDPLVESYRDIVDGFGREDLFYGYLADNEPTPPDATAWMLGYLQRAEASGVEVFVIDYCWGRTHVEDALASAAGHGFTSFVASSRKLDEIPPFPSDPVGVHNGDIDTLSDARNFLYLINPHRFASRMAFLEALRATDYDVLVVDEAFEDELLTADDVESLKQKANGGRRLVLCYLSIGEAEDYRDYWQASWASTPPEWLYEENPNWPGNYPVAYWHLDWQRIVLDAVDRIMEAGFDGLYLDRVDVYEQFE